MQMQVGMKASFSQRSWQYLPMLCALGLLAITFEIAMNLSVQAQLQELSTENLGQQAKAHAVEQGLEIPINMSEIQTRSEQRVIEELIERVLTGSIGLSVSVHISDARLNIYLPGRSAAVNSQVA